MLKKIWAWIKYSSTNEEEISLTLKGLAGFIPSVMIVLAMFHVPVSANQLNDAIQGLIVVVSTFGAVVSALYALYGAVRKVYTSVAGTNAVINNS